MNETRRVLRLRSSVLDAKAEAEAAAETETETGEPGE